MEHSSGASRLPLKTEAADRQPPFLSGSHARRTSEIRADATDEAEQNESRTNRARIGALRQFRICSKPALVPERPGNARFAILAKTMPGSPSSNGNGTAPKRDSLSTPADGVRNRACGGTVNTGDRRRTKRRRIADTPDFALCSN